MMEPLTAIGLASSIVQFVDFGNKLLTAGYSAYKSIDGVAEQYIVLEDLYSDLENLSARLRRPAIAWGMKRSPDEDALKDLAVRCQSLANELLGHLKDLRVKGKGWARAWDAVRQELRRSLRSEKVARLQNELEQIRSEIGIRLLKIIRDNQSDLQSTLNRLVAQNRDSKAEISALIHDAKAELLHAVQRLNDQGLVRNASSSSAQGGYGSGVQRLESTLNLLSDRLDKLQTVSYEITISRRVLSSLVHPKISARHAAITDAYQKTYRWIFDENSTTFKSWLQQNTDQIFWIGGKAGSGKSTLMKFIAGEPRTTEILKKWSGSARLVVASFYFWNAGSELEKSLNGLLQGLLFQLVRAVPELSSRICPKRFLDAEEINEYADRWSRKELMQAITVAVKDSALRRNARFCFFIDGLDEYEDVDKDYGKLVAMVEELASNPGVKFCVSSRPWKVFQDAFGSPRQPHFQLQYLTRDDMRKYIYGELINNPRFQHSLRQDPRIERIVNEIQHRAEGVFLWVFLVVRSLCRGLTADDSITKLEERLSLLPKDLRKFFRQALDGVDEAYLVEASRVYLMVARASDAVPVLAVYFLEDDTNNPDYALQSSTNANDPSTIREWYKVSTARVNNWCRDLLVATKPAKSSGGLLTGIAFLHRSVRDFLREEDVQGMLQRRAGKDFKPTYTLCRLHLALIKSLDLYSALNRDPGDLHYEIIAQRLLEQARICTKVDGVTPTRVLDELDKACGIYWTALSKLVVNDGIAYGLLASTFEVSTARECRLWHWTSWKLARDMNRIPPVLVSQDRQRGPDQIITSEAFQYIKTKGLNDNRRAFETPAPSTMFILSKRDNRVNRTANVAHFDLSSCSFLTYCSAWGIDSYVREKLSSMGRTKAFAAGLLLLAMVICNPAARRVDQFPTLDQLRGQGGSGIVMILEDIGFNVEQMLSLLEGKEKRIVGSSTRLSTSAS